MSARFALLFLVASSVFGQVRQDLSSVARWFSVDQASVASRFVWVHGTGGETNASQIQHQEILGASVHLLPGKLRIFGMIAPGDNFTAGWNNTGAGLGSGGAQLYLKHLYLAAKPFNGLELQYGGFGVERGLSTDITSYHAQAFVTGQRVVISKPSLWFDRVAFTYGYMGDFDRPGINKRFNRLENGNYRQLLVSKNLNDRVSFSADFTNHRGLKTLRQAVAIRVPKVVEAVRLDVYQRLTNRSAGFHAGFSRKLQQRLNLDGGYIAIDRNFGNLNNDFFFSGRRVYANPSVKLAHGLSFFSLVHRTVATNFSVPNKTFLHVGLEYNLLQAWQESFR